MNTKEPVAVLIHGHHLQAPDWEHFVWGERDLSRVGRIPRGIEVAIKEDAQLVIWGTGASGDSKTGKKESEFTHALAIERTGELAEYLGVEESRVLDILNNRSVVQVETTNTKNETQEALKVCKENGINTLYLVSTPTHVPRCLLTACQFQEDFPDIVLIGVAAESTKDYWHPKETAVVEPSHRPDRSEVPFNLLAKRMASARKYTDEAPQLYADIEALIDVFEKKVKK